jgi:hypothetical protein
MADEYEEAGDLSEEGDEIILLNNCFLRQAFQWHLQPDRIVSGKAF